MGQHERIYDALQQGAKIKLSNGLDYDGSLFLFIDGVAQTAGALVRQGLDGFPDLIHREVKIDYTESDVLPPDKKIKYPHSHVEVTVTWVADEMGAKNG